LLAGQILKQGVTCATLSPSMFNNLAAYCAQHHLQLSQLRRVVTGGAPISRDDVAAFYKIAPHAEIWILYGSTEVEPMAHIEGKEMLALMQNPDPEIVEEGVNVGHISSELEYKFIRISHDPIDARNTGLKIYEVPKGQVGEFIVTGDHVCRDYYNNPEAFIRAKIVDEKGKIWHRTGDLAFEDSSGYLWIVGRIHNVIERSGQYYFPVRAEVILKRFSFVKQAAFLGIPDEMMKERNVVAIVLEEGFEDENSIVLEISRAFEKNQIPVDSIYFVEKIPMDPRHHSKVEYSVLREELINCGVCDALAR
jgi:acyl-CoA synthetase (AMP-forming)/AMP-acid ligase II